MTDPNARTATPAGTALEWRRWLGPLLSVLVFVVVAMSLALTFLATLYPSWRAARLDPVEALRYE